MVDRGMEISEEKIAILEKLVSQGRFLNRRQALDHAVDLLQEEAETLDDIREGIASIDRGEGVDLDAAMDGLRRQHGIPNEI